MKVIVLGAGVTGTASAWYLSQSGHEVTVLDHTGGYTIFPNLGKAMAPHAVLEVRSGAGYLIWRWDRDGKKPVQVDMTFSGISDLVIEGLTHTTNEVRDIVDADFLPVDPEQDDDGEIAA